MLILNSGFDISQAKLILELVNGKTDVKKFLEANNKSEMPQGFEVISLCELSKNNIDSCLHEMAHICAWAKYGIVVEIIRKKDGSQYATGTQNLKEVCENYSKEKLIEILKNAYYAPYKAGIKHKVYGDLLIYEILCRRISNQQLVETEESIKELLKQRYPDLED